MLQPKDIDWLNGYENKTNNICCLQETHFRSRDTYRLKVRRWEKIFYVNGNQKKYNSILISEKIDLKIDCYKTQRRTMHNDQGIKSRRRYNNCKYICTLVYQANTKCHKGKNQQ